VKVERRFQFKGQGTLVDADVDARGGVVALVEVGDAHSIVGSDGSMPFELRVRWPLIRVLDDDHLLVFDRSRVDVTRNAFVVSRSGRLVQVFGVGDAIENAAVCGDRIAVSYFDEGVCSDDPFARNGVALFSRAGAFEFGYQSHFGEDAVAICDVYAMCDSDDRALWFCPYTDFPLVRLDVASRSQRILPGVPGIQGSSALTIGHESAFFHGTYDERSTLFERRLDGTAVRPIGEWSKGRLRGIPGGSFLGIDSNTVVVVTPDGAAG
jgi:hypothetical protein